MIDARLTPAPGAKAAKVCGILAIVFALTCLGIPVAFVLGIVALVQQGKAKRLAKDHPDVYAPVPATGLVTGIIGLVLPVVMVPFAGIVSAIAIPAFLSQRERAQELLVKSNLDKVRMRAEASVEGLRIAAPGQIPSQEAIIQALSGDPLLQALKNPITPSAPALQSGTSGPLGTVMVYADQGQQGDLVTWSVQFRAVVRRGGQDRVLQGEVITHSQQQDRVPPQGGPESVAPFADGPGSRL